jgi:hypothetical protein
MEGLDPHDVPHIVDLLEIPPIISAIELASKE